VTELHGERAVLRPLREGDTARLREIRAEPEVLKWWGAIEDGFPMSDEPGTVRFTILLDGGVAGMVQYREEPEPDYRHADIDIFIASEHHDGGLGTDALKTIVRHLNEDHGHHRVTIGTSVRNHRAARSYEKAGFRLIGVTHLSGKDLITGEWEDELVMELVRDPS
jgi:aminoglycoside 6'-N-acetyltransferase